MAFYAPPIARLLEELERLPGIGPKSAQRLAYHILRGDDDSAVRLADAIVDVKRSIRFCERCFNFAEGELCDICGDPGRDAAIICVVEEPRDVVAVERTGEFRGTYHVLQGAISPIDGIGPEQLRVPIPTSRGRRRRCTCRASSVLWGSASRVSHPVSRLAGTSSMPTR
jgi:recombination protein RecR